MDASHTPDYDCQHRDELLRDSLNQQRDQVREFLAAQKELVRQIEDQLVEQLDQIRKQFDDKQADNDDSLEKDYRRLYEMSLEDIHELKKLLEEQSSDNLQSVAVDEDKVAEVLDSDAVVQQERESLKQLRDELREKLSRAEIDISQERAKIAREKVQLEEKLRALDKHDSDYTSEHQDDEKTGRPAHGRWLAQLGLNSSEDE